MKKSQNVGTKIAFKPKVKRFAKFRIKKQTF